MSSRARADVDPEIYAAIRRETERQEHNLELIASENFVSEAVLEAQGSVLTNKYAEGYPGQALLRRLRVRRRGRDARHRAREGALRRRGRQRAAALGLAGQHVRVLLAARAGRHDPRDEPVARRPPDARQPRQLLRHGSSRSSPTACASATGGIDFDEVARPRARAPPEDDRGRTLAPIRAQIDFAAVPAPSPTRSARMLMADIAHFAGLVAAGLHPSPVPHCEFVTTTTHKTLRGPRGGMILCREALREGDQLVGLPRQPGRAAHARDRRQGGGVPRGARRRSSATTSGRSSPTRRRSPTALMRRGFRLCLRRHRQPPDAARPARHRAHRQGRAGDARPARASR